MTNLPKMNMADELYDPYGGNDWMFLMGCLIETKEENTYEELLHQELNDAKGG